MGLQDCELKSKGMSLYLQMKNIRYSIISHKSTQLATGILKLDTKEDLTGEQTKQRICYNIGLQPNRFNLYAINLTKNSEIQVEDQYRLPEELQELQLRERESLVEATEEPQIRKKPPTTTLENKDSIVFEETSRIGQEEEEFMENGTQNSPFVHGQVKVCRWLKCFSYEMFLELNPEISVINMYSSRKSYPKRPTKTIPLLLITKLVRLKDSPCFSRKAYMKLVLPDSSLTLCFYEKDVCLNWMKYIKQAIVYARYIEQTAKVFEAKVPNIRQTLRKSSNSKIELKDSVEPSSMKSSHTASVKSQEFPQEVSFNEKKQIILLEDFDVDKKIGSGSFGYVFLAKHKPTSRVFALKQLSKSELLQKRQLRYALTQLQILKQADHTFIVKLYYAFQTKEYLYMALTYCPNGTLKDLIQSNGKLSVEDAIIYVCELILAIEYLHQKQIIYRDLKPQNILIGSDFHIVLSDFGLSKCHVGGKDLAESFCGSPMYLCPQLLNNGSATHMSDVYGVGAVFYQMLHGHPLYEAEDIGEVFELIKTKEVAIDRDLPEKVQDFLRVTLEKRPEKRPKRMRAHPLFDSVNWKSIYNKKMHPNVQFVQQGSSIEWIQIDYKIDEDYNPTNYLDNRVEGWLYSTNVTSQNDDDDD